MSEISDISGIEASTNTNPLQNVFAINGKQKKKPYNINIKNHNKNEPKIHKVNIKRSDKQKFRTYRTKVEPNLHNKILVDAEDEIVSKIKQALGLEEPKNTNSSKVETAQESYITAPAQFNNGVDEPPTVFYEGTLRGYENYNPLSEISSEDAEDLTGMAQSLPRRLFHIDEEERARNFQLALDYAKQEQAKWIVERAEKLQKALDDAKLSQKTTDEKLLSPAQASDLIKYNYQKHMIRKDARSIANLYQVAKTSKDFPINDMLSQPILTASSKGVKIELVKGSRLPYSPEVKAKLTKQAKEFKVNQEESEWIDLTPSKVVKIKSRGRPKGSKTNNSPEAVHARALAKQKRDEKVRRLRKI